MSKKNTKRSTISPQAAFEQGQAAFASDLLVDANPYDDEQPQQRAPGFAWRRGWHLAHLQADLSSGGGNTPIFSVFPAVATRDEAQAIYDRRGQQWRARQAQQVSPYEIRDEYEALPWLLEQLVDSVWINLHTCTIHRVISIHVNTWGMREPVFDGPMGVFDDFVHCTISGPGFWASNQRYVIEHWLRFDTLPAEVQRSWQRGGEGNAVPQAAKRHRHTARSSKNTIIAATNLTLDF